MCLQGFSIFGIWIGLKPKKCPECKSGRLRLHGYTEFGGHYLDCEKCGWRLEGVD